MKDLLTSRRFWAAITGLAVLVVGQFRPGFDLDQERASALLVVILSYLLGLAVDPGSGGWQGVLRSRKFWAAVIGLVFVVASAFGIHFIFTEDQLVELAVLIAGYILSVAFEQPKLKAEARV
jgi:uncharacterized membrane protein